MSLEIIEFIKSNDIVTSSFLGVVASLIAVFISSRLKHDFSSKIQEQREKLLRIIEEPEMDIKVSGISNVVFHSFEGLNKEDLRENIESSILDKLKDNPGWSKDEIRAEINSELNAFEDRLRQIEERFPEKSAVDKIASINDAIFAERLEAITKRLENIESKSLSKWDVAIIVSTIIGSIFTVVGATYGVIAFIQSTGN
jgi:hypothetical protein